MKSILFFIVLAAPSWICSQVTPSISLLAQMPVALNEFRETSDVAPGGGGRLFFYTTLSKQSRFKVGIGAGLFGRGGTKKTIPLNILGYQDTYVVRANNVVANVGMQVQWEPLMGKRISPYIETEFGGNDFNTSISFNIKNRGDSQYIGKQGDTKDHWGLYYGGSAGLRIGLGQKRGWGVELKCSYYEGSETIYNTKPKFTEENILDFNQLSSTTDMLNSQLGIWVNLTSNTKE